jgi:mRNA interferase MazF
MRPIHLAKLDKVRPVLLLTREQVRPYLTRITVAPITSTVRGLSTEVPLDPEHNGVDHPCVVSCDNIVTVPVGALGRAIGRLMPDQESALAAAIIAAFDLDA